MTPRQVPQAPRPGDAPGNATRHALQPDPRAASRRTPRSPAHRGPLGRQRHAEERYGRPVGGLGRMRGPCRDRRQGLQIGDQRRAVRVGQPGTGAPGHHRRQPPPVGPDPRADRGQDLIGASVPQPGRVRRQVRRPEDAKPRPLEPDRAAREPGGKDRHPVGAARHVAARAIHDPCQIGAAFDLRRIRRRGPAGRMDGRRRKADAKRQRQWQDFHDVFALSPGPKRPPACRGGVPNRRRRNARPWRPG